MITLIFLENLSSLEDDGHERIWHTYIILATHICYDTKLNYNLTIILDWKANYFSLTISIAHRLSTTSHKDEVTMVRIPTIASYPYPISILAEKIHEITKKYNIEIVFTRYNGIRGNISFTRLPKDNFIHAGNSTLVKQNDTSMIRRNRHKSNVQFGDFLVKTCWKCVKN